MPGTQAEPRQFIQTYLNKPTIQSFDDVKTLIDNCDPRSPQLNPSLLEMQLLVQGLSEFYASIKHQDRIEYEEQHQPFLIDTENYISICIGVYSKHYYCWSPNRISIRCSSIEASGKLFKEVPFDIDVFITEANLTPFIYSGYYLALVYKGVAFYSDKIDILHLMKKITSKTSLSTIEISILLSLSLHEIKQAGAVDASKALFENFTAQHLVNLEMAYDKWCGFIDYLHDIFRHIKENKLNEEHCKSLYSMLMNLCERIRTENSNPFFNGVKPSSYLAWDGKHQLESLVKYCFPFIDQIALLIAVKSQIKIEHQVTLALCFPLLSKYATESKAVALKRAEEVSKGRNMRDVKDRDRQAEGSTISAMAALLYSDNTAEQKRKYFLLTYLHDVLGLFRESMAFKMYGNYYQDDPVFQVLSLLRSENFNILFPSIIKLSNDSLMSAITKLYCLAAQIEESHLGETDKKLLNSIGSALSQNPYCYQVLAHGKLSDLANALTERNKQSKKQQQPIVEVKQIKTQVDPEVKNETIDLAEINRQMTSMTGVVEQMLKQQQALTELVLKQNEQLEKQNQSLTEQLKALTETVKRLESQLLLGNKSKSTAPTLFNKP